MALEGNTGFAPVVAETKPEDVKKNEAGEELLPHTYWAQVKGHSSKGVGSEPLLNAMHYSVAKMLNKWPNPELDPSHLITEKEFDAAIEEAAGASMAQPPAKESEY